MNELNPFRFIFQQRDIAVMQLFFAGTKANVATIFTNSYASGQACCAIMLAVVCEAFS